MITVHMRMIGITDPDVSSSQLRPPICQAQLQPQKPSSQYVFHGTSLDVLADTFSKQWCTTLNSMPSRATILSMSLPISAATAPD